MEKYSIKNFEELVKDGIEYLRQTSRSESSIHKYRWTWNQIRELMITTSSRMISDGVYSFINKNFGHLKTEELNHYQKTCLRQALCLVQFSESGQMLDRMEFLAKPPLSFAGEIGSKMLDFISFKTCQRLNKITIRAYKYHLSEFNKYLTDNEFDRLLYLSPLIVLNYVSILLPGEAGAKHIACRTIRGFLRFLYDKNLTERDLSIVIPHDNYKSQAHLASTYTKEEIISILNTIDRSTCVGKRDYAILLLAVRLGLRSADIRALKFENIDWQASSISFIQQKTKRLLELPLPADVGEALVDYFKYGRPQSESKMIFIKHNYPYGELYESKISQLATWAIRKSEVKVGDRKHGAHVLRHSMANFLLEKETPLPVISAILGHSNIQTSMCYLRIDIEQLRQCTLEVPPIPESFYNQKGGYFYE